MAIANSLRNDISEARYSAGDKLPTEAALAQRFGVNRHTVRHGISALVDEGLLRTRRGAGVFVATHPTDYPIGKRVRFHENLIAAGRQPTKKVLSIETRSATQGEAHALEIKTGDTLCVYHGLSSSDGQPIALFESLFPLDRLPDMPNALAQTSSVTEALVLAGISDFTRATTRLTAMRATATQALHLNLTEGDPILKSTGVNIDTNGTPVEFGRTYFAGDRVTLTLDN